MREIDLSKVGLAVALALAFNFAPQFRLPVTHAVAGEAAAIEAPPSQCQPPPAAAGNPDALGVGDKIKLAFYEQLQAQEEKWGRKQQGPSKNFFFRGELAGIYQVESDGSIAVPMLGRFVVRDLTSAGLETLVRCSFERFIGRPGFVNVLSVARPPVSVLGPVKTAGTYDYAPGMTVLHAVALAGGIERQQAQPWQVPEYTREVERLQSSLDRAARMIARASILKNERSEDGASLSEALGQIAGKKNAAALTSEESAVRKLTIIVENSETQSLKAAQDAATADITALEGRLEPIDKAIKMRTERVDSLEKLAKAGNLSRMALIQAQGELAEISARRQETIAQMSAARDRLSKVQVDLERIKVRSGSAVAQDLAAAQIEYQKALAESNGALGIARSMAKAQRAPTQAEVRYRVLRRGPTGPVTIEAQESTELKPGDVVQVVDGTAAAAAAAAAESVETQKD